MLELRSNVPHEVVRRVYDYQNHNLVESGRRLGGFYGIYGDHLRFPTGDFISMRADTTLAVITSSHSSDDDG